MSTLISCFQSHVEATRSARTATAYVVTARALVAYLETIGVAESPSEDAIRTFLARPLRDGHRRAATTCNHELAALRVLGRLASSKGFWPSDPAIQIPFVRGAARDPAVLSIHEVQRFFRAAAREKRPVPRARALAILALLSQAGLRVHELVALDVQQVDVDTATLVAVHGKGGTVHDVPLNVRALELVIAWPLCANDRETATL